MEKEPLTADKKERKHENKSQKLKVTMLTEKKQINDEEFI